MEYSCIRRAEGSQHRRPRPRLRRAIPSPVTRTERREGVDEARARQERFRSARRAPEWAVLEGFHPLKHALRFGAEIEEIATRDPAGLAALAERLAPDLRRELVGRAVAVSAEVFRRLSPHPPATGVIARARRRRVRPEEVLEAPRRAPAILLEEPGDPGNLGAAIRVAAAGGAAGLVVLGSADPWQPAALRGAAGLHYALPVARADELRGWSGPLVALHPEAAPLRPGELPDDALLAFGAERRGLGPALRRRADLHRAIPMEPGISSLNLATAVAVALYAWRLGGV